jgi:hypothetical protein
MVPAVLITNNAALMNNRAIDASVTAITAKGTWLPLALMLLRVHSAASRCCQRAIQGCGYRGSG